ncbi:MULTISPECIES: hypothetical protein [unclassified Spirosoma]|uniref:hypothetical protein n=1 Tax=unclassified Spirosoma TaxID=2621999 RepID=UPI0009631ABC|nr:MULTISPECIES: hypothetical protein [unclassified Spirosoma]MBN8823057.1 hypothetical protein [Spirosoma sp.]OJW73156.1 MAG: hypothetical protein BGO59_06595 [Spirosoma sp. 48-14]
MVRKAVLTTLLLLLLYSLFIYAFQGHIHRTGLTVQQNNIVKAEEFLYENGQKADTVVVGSSMSNRLLFDSLPGHYYNLALEGLSSADGLGLIAQAKHRPRLLLIETNSMDRLPDTAFFAALTKPALRVIREYLPLTRLKYQPVGVIKALFRDLKTERSPMVSTEAIDTTFVSKLIQARLVDMNRIPPENEMQAKIDVSAAYIKRLQESGTQVIFFEMPTDPRVRNTILSGRVRKLVGLTFPESAYHYVQFPSDFYQTTDGVHLPWGECARYTRYLNTQLSQSAVRLTEVR